MKFVRSGTSNFKMSRSKKYGPPLMKDFVLTEKIGEGTYATVYKGYRKGNFRDVVAVKCINKKSLNKNSSENLIREIEILKSLDHRHIVKLKDFIWDSNHVYLILEYCSGGDLSSYIRRYKYLSEDISRKFLRQLAMALQYIREKNISHMDLKPQNLLIESKENLILKVGDFGFAQCILDKEGRDNLRGSPLYMAVEMFSSDSYDASVDLWSTGVILHESIFGYAPFASPTYEELKEKILSVEPIVIPSQPKISPHCKDLLSKLLQRNPVERITFEDFFKHPFVDLEHAPGPASFSKAVANATSAVKYDEKKDFKNAMMYYCYALEYFLPAIEYEENAEKKAAIRLKVKQYMDRAEQLKNYSKTLQKIKGERFLATDECIKLAPEYAQVIYHAESGEKYDDLRQYGKAVDEYRKGIDISMKLLKGVEKGTPLSRTLRQKTEEMLDRMEELTRYRDIVCRDNDLRSVNVCGIQ